MYLQSQWPPKPIWLCCDIIHSAMTALLSMSLHRALSQYASPLNMSQRLLFPWCFVLGLYPSRAASLWTPTTSSKKNEPLNEGRKKKIKKIAMEKELCIPNHVPMGFQLQRWGWSKQFCLLLFFHFVGSFVSSFSVFFCFFFASAEE